MGEEERIRESLGGSSLKKEDKENNPILETDEKVEAE